MPIHGFMIFIGRIGIAALLSNLKMFGVARTDQAGAWWVEVDLLADISWKSLATVATDLSVSPQEGQNRQSMYFNTGAEDAQVTGAPRSWHRMGGSCFFATPCGSCSAKRGVRFFGLVKILLEISGEKHVVLVGSAKGVMLIEDTCYGLGRRTQPCWCCIVVKHHFTASLHDAAWLRKGSDLKAHPSGCSSQFISSCSSLR